MQNLTDDVEMNRLSQEHRQGVISTVLASFFLGWAPILGKFAYRAGVAPFTLVAFRTLLAALILWGAAFLFWPRQIPISFPALLGCVAVGAVNGVGSLLYYTSLSRLDASRAALLNTLYPLWVVLFLFASGQPVTWLTLQRLILSMAGVFLLTAPRPGHVDWLGFSLMLASAAAYGWHLVLGQWVIADVPPRSAALYILTTMACVVGIARLLQRHPIQALSPAAWAPVLALGLTTALSRLATFTALQRLGGVETALVGLLELLVSLVLAYLLLGERLTLVQWTGAALLVVSLFLMVRDPGVRLARGNVPLEWRRK